MPGRVLDAGGSEDRPLVSVIMIFHNAPVDFFEQAIASVIAQTETRWELLLVDDGSTDHAADLARRAAAAHPGRMRVLTHPHNEQRGMSASRNLGLDAAGGAFIAFLDADDVYLPEKLERQLAALASHPAAALVYGPTVHWWSWSGDPADAPRDHPRRLGVPPETLVDPPQLVRMWLRRQADTPATCGVLVRRAAVEAVGGFEPQFQGLFEDQAFFFKLLLQHAAFVQGTAYDRYRRHPAAFCEVRIRAGEHTDDYSPSAARRTFLEWWTEYLNRTGLADKELRALLHRELMPYRHPHRHAAVGNLRGAARAGLPTRVRRLVHGLLGRAGLLPHTW